jgi:hypothetical protein
MLTYADVCADRWNVVADFIKSRIEKTAAQLAAQLGMVRHSPGCRMLPMLTYADVC